MKCQAFVERVEEKEVWLCMGDISFVLPRVCLPSEVQEADIIDMVVFVNEKETSRQIEQLRRWLQVCGVQVRQTRKPRPQLPV